MKTHIGENTNTLRTEFQYKALKKRHQFSDLDVDGKEVVPLRHAGARGRRYISYSFLTSALDGD
jgi:hypothetical protein